MFFAVYRPQIRVIVRNRISMLNFNSLTLLNLSLGNSHGLGKGRYLIFSSQDKVTKRLFNSSPSNVNTECSFLLFYGLGEFCEVEGNISVTLWR